jgi:hypothetical protein
MRVVTVDVLITAYISTNCIDYCGARLKLKVI